MCWAQHSAWPPGDLACIGWEQRGGVLWWFFAHRKQMLPAFRFVVFGFFSPGKSSSALMAFGSKSDRGKPAAHLHLQRDPLSTMRFSLGLQQLCKGVKGQSRCLGDSPKKHEGQCSCRLFSCTPVPGALIPSCPSLHFGHGRSWLHSQMFPGVWLKATQLTQGHR